MTDPAAERAFVGVDVGTTQARAGIFDVGGALLATASRPIALWHEPGDIVEQSSTDIWSACCGAVQAAMANAGLPASAVKGIGFDATCSLVALDSAAAPVTISPSGESERNVIVWMDHRARAEAREISETGDAVLRFVGGVISPEMQTPKLLWLKRHLPASYAGAAHFFDLADYLSFRATGSEARSTCTVTCKWTYLAHERRWSDSYFERIGLGELVADGGTRIGSEIVEPGSPLGRGLTRSAADELGLLGGTPVGASLIDAHAGGIGSLGPHRGGERALAQERVACVMGTSACVMAATRKPHFVPGLWGPSFSGMIPGLWLNEGGLTAAGAGLDHLVRSHPASIEAGAAAAASGLALLDFLERRALARFATVAEVAFLARHLHVLPEFLGNRSPFADAEARAVIAGLGLDSSIDGLERLFVAGVCGLVYGLADVVDAMQAHGIRSGEMVMSGGAAHSSLVRQIAADAMGITVSLPVTTEPVLLGASMLGAIGAGIYQSIPEAMSAMSAIGHSTEPATRNAERFHAAKRRVQGLMRQLDRESRSIMANSAIETLRQ